MNQNYNFVGGLFSQEPNFRNEVLSTKKSTSFKRFLLLTVFAFFANFSVKGQTTLISPSGDGGFETGATFAANGWVVSNFSSSENRWAIGSAVTAAPFSNRSAYISTDSGLTNTYSNISPNHVYLYRDVVVPAGSQYLPLSFNFDIGGESLNDILQVFVAPTTITPVSGIYPGSGNTLIPADITGATQIGFFQALTSPSTPTTPRTASLTLPASYAGQTVRLIFMWKNDTTSGNNPPAAIDNVSLTAFSTPSLITSTTFGGLWSSPSTWVGGIVPPNGTNVAIGASSIVTVDQSILINNLNINGTLQWNAIFTNTFTVSGNLSINSGGKYLPYTTTLTGALITTNIGGNFLNNGYANFAFGALNFNGSGSTLSGTGIFEGDGTRGIIRSLQFQNLGSNSINIEQDLTINTGIVITAGSLNTNGKLKIDNTAQIYGRALNLQVASVVVTNMGSLYTVAPVVFGAAVTQWNSITGVLNTLYVSGNNVYRCTTVANIGAAAPTHTSGTADNLLWVGTTGTLGNSFLGVQVHVLGTQYFYGNNLYTCTVAGTASSTVPPVHTLGAIASGTATFLYVGTVAKVSVNFDSVTGTVRSLNLTQTGSGYTSSPSTAFSVGVLAGTGSGAAAAAVHIQQITGTPNSLTQKSGAAIITGGLIINSDQGASIASTDVQASSGVGNISTLNGGVNYTVPPLVGFAGPATLNLVTNAGSGYTVVPTVTITGGTLVSGTALVTANFTITMNQGKVVSVYLNTATSATYSVPPTLSFSIGTATLAFPTGCWPAATANLGSNGQITSFTMTNAGFGYAAAPIVGVGTTTATTAGGTFTTVATAPTARIALYNLTINWFTPAVASVVASDDAFIPTNRKLNNLSLAGSGNGLNLTNNLVLFGTIPLGIVANNVNNGNILDLGNNNLLCTWYGYSGTTSLFGVNNGYLKNGSMTLTNKGGGTTGVYMGFPFSGSVIVFTGGGGSNAVTAGTDALTVKVTDVAAPGNTVAGGTGIALGNRAFKIDTATTLGAPTTSPTLFGGTLPPTVRLSYNVQDGLTTTQDQTFIVEASSLNGAWNVRSSGFGASGLLPEADFLTTGANAPTAVLFNSGNFYAWGTGVPTIAGVTPTVLCANSGAFSITGTNFSGVTAVKIGGTAVLSFTVVNATTITGYAGPGTSGNISITKNGLTVTGIENITFTTSPSTPSVTTAAVSINLGGTVTVTASGGSGTFKWYDAVSGGTLLYTGSTFSAPVCSGNIWVGLDNGSCEGLRTMVTITTVPTAIVTTANSFCGTVSSLTLTASPADASITYSWTSLTAPVTVTPATGGTSVTSILNQTSDFRLTASKGTCTAVINKSIGVYALPSATVTTTAQGVCPGTSATISSGLVAGNFAVTSVPYLEYLAPTNAVVVCANGTPNVPLTGGSLNDGGWSGLPIGFNFNFFGTSFNTISAGTNGFLMFGTPLGYTSATYNLGQNNFNTTGGVFPNAANPGNVIALMAANQNFDTGTTSTLTYWTQGYAPNRIFVIEYSKVNPVSSTANFTAQARLYETLGTVDIAIVSKSATNSATVGLQDATRTIGAVAPGRQAFTSTITTPETWRFTPPANYATSWFANNVLIPATTGFVNPGTNVFNLSVAPAATTTYSISYTNQTTGCTNTAGSAQVSIAVLGNTIPAGINTIASEITICTGQAVNFSTSYTGSTDGMVFQWQNSTNSGATWTDIASAQAFTYSTFPALPSQYRCKMVVCNGVPGYSSATTIGFSNLILSSIPASRCGTGIATLGATGSTGTSVNWYDSAAGGTFLGTGTSFVTPVITASTTYYAAAETATPPGIILGSGNYSQSSRGYSFFPSGINTGGAKTQYIIKASELLAAGVTPGNITSLGFEPTDSGQTYQGFSVSLGATSLSTMTITTFETAGLSQVYLGTLSNNGFTPVANTLNVLAFGTGAGSTSAFSWNGTSNIVVSISWSSVPATSSSIPTYMKADYYDFGPSATKQSPSLTPAEMLASTVPSGTSSYRPRFTINCKVICSSPRVAVVASVTAPPAITLSGNPATICSEQSSAAVTVVTGRSNYDTYVWTPSTSVTGNATTGWVFNPLTTTAYALAVSQSTGAAPCATTIGITVSVNPTPSVLTIAPASASICADSILPLVANGGSRSIQIGTGISDNLISTPYKVFWGGTKTQALYTATELSSLGLIGGASISSIGHVILSGTPLLMNNYSVRVGFVSATTLGTTFIAGATNIVLNNVAFTPPTGAGNIDYALTTPIVWDGVSNLLVETCFNNNNSGGSNLNNLSVASAAAVNLSIYRSFSNLIDGCSSNDSFLTGSRPNLRISVLNQVTWSPSTNLYSDAAATIPYSGGNATTVYVKSSTGAATRNYTATATSALGCARTATVPVTIYQTLAPTGAATQSLSSLLTVGNIVVVGTNVVWYSSSANAASGTNPLPSSTLLANTTYYATQTVAGCASVTSLAVTITTLANQDFDMTQFSYYPNPVIDLLNVSYSQDMTNVKVFNMIGQQLLNKDVNAKTTQIDMSAYANGAYFIQVSTENAMKTVRVIKK